MSPSKGKKEKKKLLQDWVFVFGHPSRCEARRTGLNFVEGRDVVLSMWYSDLENESFVNSYNFDATDLRFLSEG